MTSEFSPIEADECEQLLHSLAVVGAAARGMGALLQGDGVDPDREHIIYAGGLINRLVNDG